MRIGRKRYVGKRTNENNYHGFLLFLTIAGILIMNSESKAQPTVERFKESRNEYVEHFRKTGFFDEKKANEICTDINKFLETSTGEQHARAEYELATMLRMKNKFEDAIKHYEQCITLAPKTNDTDLVFDAYIGIARSHMIGTHNHGAAASAFEQAVIHAGNNPTRKQRYDMADYESQLQSSRGELESALINSLKAIDLASNDSELFYAQLDVGDVLQKFAESCDYRKIEDASSCNDGADSWGACRRAVHSARKYYEEAKRTAQKLQWNFLEQQVDGYLKNLDFRLFLIEQKASFEKLGTTAVFTAQDVHDVLVNENFLSGASELSDSSALGMFIKEIVPDEQTMDPRSNYLLGLKADLEKKPEEALIHFKKAVESLYAERMSFFDPRQRGTVVENRLELVRDLALRLLSSGQTDEAFSAFESLRAYGLSSLMQIYRKIDFSDAERKLFANLICLESQKSALQTDLVYTTIAEIKYSKSSEALKELQQKEQRVRDLFDSKAFQEIIKKIAAVTPATPKLDELKTSVTATNIPVIFYWITHTNVLVWVISPKGMEIKTVFLPEVAVNEKVGKLIGSIRTEETLFDEKTARELYAYLVAPFSQHLSYQQVIIVPQGSLLQLPFEVLVNGTSGKYFAEEIAISYAPNAEFALQKLQEPVPSISQVNAIYDAYVENITKEISRISRIKSLKVNAGNAVTMNNEKIMSMLNNAENVHVLLHGKFNTSDPLQSEIIVNGAPCLTAAELLAIDWKKTKLAVFSSCEGGVVQTRISNELFGIAWALLAGGVDNIILSRWLVQSEKNADWMEAFYKAIVSGNISPSLAANTAMRTMIITNRNKPYYWAAPQVYGR